MAESVSSRQPASSSADLRSSIAIRWTVVGLLAGVIWTVVDLRTTLAAAASRVGQPADGLRIDPITATAAELELIPGIGPATAGRIVAHRLEHGPRSLIIEDSEGAGRWALDAVPGIGPITTRRAAPYLVRVGSAGTRRASVVRP
jgi:hypothetical protein